MTDPVQLDVDGAVATMTLARAMPPAYFTGLERAVDAVEANHDVRVLLIRGAEPKAFCYGLDLQATFKEHGKTLTGAGLAADRTRLLALIRELQRPFKKLAALRVPTVAAVHGWCLGGGVDLITACDIRLASADAKFGVRETKIAIVADLGSLQRLPGIIGEGHARDLIFTGRDIDAERALRIGLVNDVYPDHDALFAAAAERAREIADNAPLTVQGAKAVLNRTREPAILRGYDDVATWNAAFLPSEDLAEAVSAHMARRPPSFKGR